MLDQQMLRATASALADAWIEEFAIDTIFFVNGVGLLEIPPNVVGTRGLFHTDLDAGVLAVSVTKVGLFWNSENS